VSPERSTLHTWAAQPGQPPTGAFTPETLALLDRCGEGESCSLVEEPQGLPLTRRRRSWLALLLLLSAIWSMTTAARP
jgi:hypothetical protein